MPGDPIVILTDPAMLAHNPGPGHPERPARLQAILDALDRNPISGVCRATPSPATREQIQRIHDSEYVNLIDSLRGKHAQLDPDTAVSPSSVDAAYLAAGAAINAVDALLSPLPLGEGSGVRAETLPPLREGARGCVDHPNSTSAARPSPPLPLGEGSGVRVTAPD
ncbi:MAG: hypothetical protein L0219_00480, partial [Phycisphaerales bacterium]|nr:hypothetical protein [Phycisphaerales bacterium]